MPAAKSPSVEIEVDDRVVRVSNPDRVYFPESGATKLDLVEYYLAVGRRHRQRALRAALHAAPVPQGAGRGEGPPEAAARGGPAVGGDRALHFPRWNRTADELCVTELASVIWAVQMSTVEFHPWNSRRDDTEKPDEWRIDLDPGPLCDYATVRRVAHVAHEVLDELGATGFPKTSGSKGMHVYVRIRPEHGFKDVRRAALAFAREVERRAPDDVTTTWWRKDRDPHHLFVDYNQNARDHTIAAAYSVRGLPDARVSTPIRWDEVDDRRPARLHDLHGARRGSPRSATCTPTSTTTSSTSPRCWSGPSATSGRAPRRPPTPRSEPGHAHGTGQRGRRGPAPARATVDGC